MPQYLATLSYSLHFCCNLHPNPESSWGFLIRNFYIYLLCVCLHICHDMLVELTGQLGEASAPLSPVNSRNRTWIIRFGKKYPCLQGNLAHPCTIAFFVETVYVIKFCEYLQMIRIFSFFLGSIFSLNDLYFMCF